MTHLDPDIQALLDERKRTMAEFTPDHRPLLIYAIYRADLAMPAGKEDDLAEEAMHAIAEQASEAALLLFKMIPYREVAGHRYSFGGLLYWQGCWHPFALNAGMGDVDAVINQVESGFDFDVGDAAYADDHSFLAIPFNRLCFELDPNESTPMLGVAQGDWVTLFPAGI